MYPACSNFTALLDYSIICLANKHAKLTNKKLHNIERKTKAFENLRNFFKILHFSDRNSHMDELFSTKNELKQAIEVMVKGLKVLFLIFSGNFPYRIIALCLP